MKGKNYLLVAGILIISGALTGLALSILSLFGTIEIANGITAGIGNKNTALIEAGFSILLLISGIIGIINRRKPNISSVVWGFIPLFLLILAIPFMFWAGNGSAPAGMLVAGLAGIPVFVLYLTGAFLNRNPRFSIFLR